jgi:acetolactate synthase-1/2/3 large subunit
MKMIGAQAILKALELENIEVIFGYPGAAICPFYNALPDSSIRHILTRHEQGAAHAASGYARVTGKTGVCVATSGPGATNLITGIATAYMDSIPIVAITGQVSTDQIGKDVFQEADITGATAPFCKHNYLVSNVEDLPKVIKEAFHIASTGRPGPVLIDVPIDIQENTIDFKYPETIEMRGYKPTYRGHILQIRKIAEAIENAKAPVICAGGGVINAKAADKLIQLVERCRIPVTTTLMGIGVIPSNHELNLGMIGSHGSYMANYAVNNADLLLIIGARVGDRAMGSARKIAKKAQIVHIDIDPAEIGKNVEVSIPVVGDAGFILEELLRMAKKGDIESWDNIIAAKKMEHPPGSKDFTDKGSQKSKTIDPRYLINLVSDIAGDNAIITTEVGQNQIWAANYFKIRRPRAFITSGGMGTMGYGLPAALGAKIGSPESKVITISGDGSFQMSMQELGTIKQYNLGVKIIILNNSRLGMVRELQKNKYCGRYSQVYMENNPDFIKLADAYGFKGQRISSNDQAVEALKKMLSDDNAYILECIVDPEEPTL